MNTQKCEIMNTLTSHYHMTQRGIAEYTGYSLGKVNGALKELISEGYLNNELKPTDKAILEMESRRPRNAVILAAGYGMRMVPINVEEPKGLLEVHGEPLIERIICQLHEAGIWEIDIIAGFMKERYEYLIDKYEINLVYNPFYSSKNNLHSLNCVKDKLGNSYIIPCDIWSEENPFSANEWYSWYMVTDELSEKSSVKINRKRELVRTKKNDMGNVMIGISYILDQDAEELREKLSEYTGRKEYDQTFWETALFDAAGIILGAKLVQSEKVYEINTYEQLRELDDNSNQLQSEILELIAKVLGCRIGEIERIRALKKGMTNRSFEFSCRGKRYIMRIPGEGTGCLINRKNEYRVYDVLKGKNITDPVLYISAENGYKLTEYIEDARNCDKSCEEDVKKCMNYLREFHEQGFWVEHEFHLFEQIEYYEKLRGNEPSIYKDYAETKHKMYELKAYIEEQPKQIGLTHIDAVCDNFLLTDKRIYLIDWEYAGMQDVHVDIAMFAIYAMYDREQIEKLIDYYFVEPPAKETKIKIYCYIAVCGFLWSNWCEYKRSCGVEFGEYSLRQYRYAKEYYKLVQKERKDLKEKEECIQ